MREKLKKLIYEYSLNSRITSKELGKKTNTSQQSAFYLLNSLKEKEHLLEDTCIVDPLKLGYMNTIVGMNFIKIDTKTQKDIIEKLQAMSEIVAIEESTEGVDLLVEFSTENLGQFDQSHRTFMEKSSKEINTAFIFPIISKFIFSKKYLKNSKIHKQQVLFGDRRTRTLNETQEKVLNELVKNPTKKIVDIAEDLKINIKAVTKAKKYLESEKIIKGYSTILNHKELEINREIMFLRFTSEGLKDIQKFIEYAKQHKNIVEASKLIGSSQAVIVLENSGEIDIIREIRSKFKINTYMILRSNRIYKRNYFPVEK
jgi:DNA-binding Lrp family transcriptional regulator